MLRFVTADAESIKQKRKQVQRACDGCRAKKKRCHHTSDPELPSDTQPSPRDQTDPHLDVVSIHQSFPATDSTCLAQVRSGPSHQTSQSIDVTNPSQQSNSVLSHRSETLGSRFVGDLNPEGIFLSAASPRSVRWNPSNDSVGVWLAEKINKSHRDCTLNSKTSLLSGLSLGIQKFIQPILEEECLSLLPPDDSTHNLTAFYFDRCHPIFPIINERAFRSLAATDPAYILLQQGICLVASMNPSTKKDLFIPDRDGLLSHREFGKRLFSAMRISVEVGLVTDKIVLVQALALMWMFLDGPDARDISSMMCARAVQYIQSLGLHVYRKDHGQIDPYESTLLCCVWAIDRLNAAFHGRPVLMHERDFGTSLTEYFDLQPPCARVFLRIISWLDKVIAIYRPIASPDSPNSYNPELEVAFESFENLLVQSDGLRVPSPLLATVETLYHAVAMLSCRPKNSSTTLLSSALQSYRDLSAERVTLLLKDGCKTQLTYFPFVPYAISLSLSVAYTEMRHTRVPMYRTRARDKLQKNCDILEQLGELFYLAEIMASMCNSTLKEYDRVYSTVAETHQRSRAGSISGPPNRAATAQHVETSRNFDAASSTPQDIRSSNQPIGEAFPANENLNPDIYFDLPDLDLFGLFDPNFDLGKIDAHFQGNLDLSYPINF